MKRNKKNKAKHRKKGRRHSLLSHLSELGFTNRLAIYLVVLLLVGLVGGFVLALLSIKYLYMGALACYTVVFTPMGTAISIVLAKVVNKNQEENTGADGEGITYAIAMAEFAAGVNSNAQDGYNI